MIPKSKAPRYTPNGRYNIPGSVMRDFPLQIITGNQAKPLRRVYLPFHAMILYDKMTSHPHIVFDGSAYEDGYSSLNQRLYTGPNLRLNILELLQRFRENLAALTADVKYASLQIELDFPEWNFTRFYWSG
ncbi:integrase catalytic domain-containing protein [Nephila pilipes]|uniref:Integrase catalytic domain-containing protein n=1 Tax=Nephila pilipes TaxID=299642 RepID=A0A8X6MW88_NEPPI|nr:integrase catalytic domain-containing protein [Nephila pilipes]